jgi:hypothetical protein
LLDKVVSSVERPLSDEILVELIWHSSQFQHISIKTPSTSEPPSMSTRTPKPSQDINIPITTKPRVVLVMLSVSGHCKKRAEAVFKEFLAMNKIGEDVCDMESVLGLRIKEGGRGCFAAVFGVRWNGSATGCTRRCMPLKMEVA